MKNIVTFMHYVGKLKEIKRAGWLCMKLDDTESVADHSYRVSLLSLILSKEHPEIYDRTKCIIMALIHDLAEAIVGDITPYDNITIQDKNRKEQEAISDLCNILKDNEILDLWKEFEEGKTPEAKLIRDLDVIETVLQALEYETQDRASHEAFNSFWDWAIGRIESDIGKKLIKHLISERRYKSDNK